MTTKTKTTNEVFLLLTGKWLSGNLWVAEGRWKNEGGAIEVSFDPDQVIQRHEEYKDVIGFYHTHPNMSATPSSTDITTMNAWVDVLGRHLICLIHGKDGLKAYLWYGDNQYCLIKAVKFKKFFFGIGPKEDQWTYGEPNENYVSPRTNLSPSFT